VPSPLSASWSRRELLRAVGGLAIGAGAWQATGTLLSAQAVTKDHRLIVHSDRPIDYETPPELLDPYLTPVESFFVRSHMTTPTIDAAAWRLAIGGDVTWPA